MVIGADGDAQQPAGNGECEETDRDPPRERGSGRPTNWRRPSSRTATTAAETVAWISSVPRARCTAIAALSSATVAVTPAACGGANPSHDQQPAPDANPDDRNEATAPKGGR